MPMRVATMPIRVATDGGTSADGVEDEEPDWPVDGGGLERGATDGAGGGMVSGVTSAGNLVPHIPWTIAPIAAIHEAMATRREAIGTAPMASSYVDDPRPPFRRATLFLLGAYLTLEWGGSQYSVGVWIADPERTEGTLCCGSLPAHREGRRSCTACRNSRGCSCRSGPSGMQKLDISMSHM
jgi:hypothetical protein